MIPQHIQEHIERECAINEPRQWMSAEQSASYMERQISIQQAALRGAEIALENQWIKLTDEEIEHYPKWLSYDEERGSTVLCYLYTFGGEYHLGRYCYEQCRWENDFGYKINDVTHIQVPTPPNE